MSFDLLELSVENPGEWDSARAAIWRPLAETQDALARDGLPFLRGALT